jgi:hypothetical protein
VSAAFVIDAVVAALLAATCAFCFLLNRKLNAVRMGQTVLADALASFDAAARRAEAALLRVDSGREAARRELEPLLARASGLAADLSIMTDAAERAADRLEEAVRARRVDA